MVNSFELLNEQNPSNIEHSANYATNLYTIVFTLALITRVVNLGTTTKLC